MPEFPDRLQPNRTSVQTELTQEFGAKDVYGNKPEKQPGFTAPENATTWEARCVTQGLETARECLSGPEHAL